MNDRDDRARDGTQEAAEWYVANRAGLEATQRRRFTRWLKFSPANVREYLAIAAVVRDLRTAPWPVFLSALPAACTAASGPRPESTCGVAPDSALGASLQDGSPYHGEA
jgi:ferric-dicitrate binding protein FerR (iron transport regulator)